MNTENTLAQVAEDYRREGYQVTSHPEAGDLPGFAAGLAVDLVAYRDDENVLVQVKTNRQDLKDDQTSLRLAELVESHPKWRLDLVVLNADALAYQVPPNASEPSIDAIEQDLARADRMIGSGNADLSCLLAWAALEALMCRAARLAGLNSENAAASFLLRALYSRGFLRKDDFERMNEALPIRNALAHGLAVPAIQPDLPQSIIKAAKSLMAENGKPNLTVAVGKSQSTATR